jgi:succinate-semialdehyde dehydrogenase/glutarate-semialdehyde dehydrogenase
MAISIGINPATGEKIRIQLQEEALEKIAASKREYEQWKQKTFEERATLMYALANVLIRTRKNTQLATREMGKVIGQSRKEIENVLWYADIMQKMQLHY